MMRNDINSLDSYRILNPLFWAILIQWVSLSIYLLGFHFQLNLVQWVTTWVDIMVDLTTWLYFFLLVFVALAESLVCSKNYFTKHPYFSSRFAAFLGFFSVQNATYGLLNMFAGSTIAWTYLSLSGDKYSTYRLSDGTNLYLNEYRFFLILGATCISLFFFVRYLMPPEKLVFPVVQQPKYAQVTPTIWPTVKESFWVSSRATVAFTLIYFVYGGTVRNSVTSSSGLETIHPTLDMTGQIFNLELVMLLCYISTVVITTFNLNKIIFQVYLTEAKEFPIRQARIFPDEVLLGEQLLTFNCPILQHLAFLDLSTVARHSEPRRAELFTLSQPGGHPHAWTSVLNPSLELMSQFTSLVDGIIRYSCDAAILDVSNHVGNPTRIHVRHTVEVEPDFIDGLFIWVSSRIRAFLNLPFFVYFFGTQDESQVEYMMSFSTLMIWAADALSHLAVASFTEDSFGIIHKDLDRIVNAIYAIQTRMDGLKRVKPEEARRLAPLNKSVVRSMTRMAIAYEPFLQDIGGAGELLRRFL